MTGFTYELPIGRNKLLNLNSRIADSLLGGFKVNGIYTFQSGAPVFFSNDLVLIPGQTLKGISVNARQTTGSALSPSFDTAASNQFAYHVRTLPQTLGSVRQDGINNLDASLLKDFHFSEQSFFQLRFETFNALNHASFAAPTVSSATGSTFGQITSQGNIPRGVQLGGLLVF